MRVAEVMTTEVLTVKPDTSLKQVAELLTRCGISGLPVVDAEGQVIGVVSEADIILKERRRRKPGFWRRVFGGDEPLSAKASARTAGEAMTSPAVTVTADRRIDAAAALMLDRQVNRLPVLDRAGKLAGIVTRADLVRAFVHTDEEIVREIREEVLVHELWLNPEDFQVTVERGEVTVEAPTQTHEERELLTRRIGLVPGVVTVDVHAVTQV
jgi:CBS-domain-containing membrane protein